MWATLIITDEADGQLRGTFHTALGDSAFAGIGAEVSGIHSCNCVQFAFARSGPEGDVICSFTGLLRDGRLETVWHVVSDSAASWAHAVHTNADTFQHL